MYRNSQPWGIGARRVYIYSVGIFAALICTQIHAAVGRGRRAAKGSSAAHRGAFVGSAEDYLTAALRVARARHLARRHPTGTTRRLSAPQLMRYTIHATYISRSSRDMSGPLCRSNEFRLYISELVFIYAKYELIVKNVSHLHGI